MSSIILNNKDIEKYGQNFKYDKKYPLQKKIFLDMWRLFLDGFNITALFRLSLDSL